MRVLASAAAACLAIGFALTFHSVLRWVNPSAWIRGVISGTAYFWLFASTGAYLLHWMWSRVTRAAGPDFDPSRRKLAGAAGHALVAAPFAFSGFGALVQR